MSNNLGDFIPGDTIYIRFNTHKSDGTPVTFLGSPSLAVYKNSNTTETSSGVTLTVDFDSKTGLNLAVIDTSADSSFYSANADFVCTVTAGTVNGISVVGSVVGEFSIKDRYHGEPFGTGTVEVDHNYGGADNLSYVAEDDIGIDNAEVKVFLTSDYEANHRTSAYVIARTTTTVEGRWQNPLMLDPADYTILYFKQGEYGPDTKAITVE